MFLIKQIQNNGWFATECRETNDFVDLTNQNKWEEHNTAVGNQGKSMKTASSAGSHKKSNKSKNQATGAEGAKTRKN